jgi:hypothetical protein
MPVRYINDPQVAVMQRNPKTLTPSVFDVMGAVMYVLSLSSYGAPFYA